MGRQQPPFNLPPYSHAVLVGAHHDTFTSASHLLETPSGVDQVVKDLENGWTEISVSVPNTSQLRWWLRGFGPDVVVEGPDGLVAEFKAESRVMAEHYANGY